MDEGPGRDARENGGGQLYGYVAETLAEERDANRADEQTRPQNPQPAARCCQGERQPDILTAAEKLAFYVEEGAAVEIVSVEGLKLRVKRAAVSGAV